MLSTTSPPTIQPQSPPSQPRMSNASNNNSNNHMNRGSMTPSSPNSSFTMGSPQNQDSALSQQHHQQQRGKSVQFTQGAIGAIQHQHSYSNNYLQQQVHNTMMSMDTSATTTITPTSPIYINTNTTNTISTTMDPSFMATQQLPPPITTTHETTTTTSTTTTTATTSATTTPTHHHHQSHSSHIQEEDLNNNNNSGGGAAPVSREKKGKWHVNAMGSIIYKEHDSYDLMRQIQMGIRTVISEVTPKKHRELSAKDFSHIEKLNFPNAGTHRSPPHDHPSFVFYDYAPLCFRHLRERFGIDAAHFMLSVCHDESLSILGTPGKSGALFFFSQDMRYILKTVTKKESKFLRKVLAQYYNHVMANPSTLITRFYGLYSIKPTGQLSGNNVRFIVMNNVFDTQKDVFYRYDLKGSTIGREASTKEKSRLRPVLKDLDFMDEQRKIRVGPKMKSMLLDQLRSDCKFMESMKIMDYSLLLGVHSFPASDLENYVREMEDPLFLSQVYQQSQQQQQQQQPMEQVHSTMTTTAVASAATATNTTNVTTTASTDVAPTLLTSTTGTVNDDSGTASRDTSPASTSQETTALSQQPSMDTSAITVNDIELSVIADIDGRDYANVNYQNTANTTTTTTTVQNEAVATSHLQVPTLTTTTTTAAVDSNTESSTVTTQKKSTLVNRKSFAGRILFAQPQLQIEKHFHGEDHSSFQKFHGGLLSPVVTKDGNREIYFVGVIDILQKWNNRKQLENIFKGMKYDKAKISSVNPKNYAHRFCDFVEKAME